MRRKSVFAVALALALAPGWAFAQDGKRPPNVRPEPPAERVLPLRGDPAKAVVLIVNHGTLRPQFRHVCNEDRDVPAVMRDIADARQWTIFYLCSAALDGGEAGSYTYKRADEILAAVALYRGRGVPAQRIFLVGHSAGAWSSLMAARKNHGGFNAIVAFAPAFAGPRHEAAQFPWWRGRIALEQIAYLRQAPRIDALIFAYSDDEFDRPSDLAPLAAIPGIRILAFDACHSGHGTTYSECFRVGARVEIEHYIKTRLAGH
jgi:hypothetical protein